MAVQDQVSSGPSSVSDVGIEYFGPQTQILREISYLEPAPKVNDPEPRSKSNQLNCLRFANPAEALGGRHLEAWRRCMEAQKLGGSDALILAISYILLMAS